MVNVGGNMLSDKELAEVIGISIDEFYKLLGKRKIHKNLEIIKE